MFTHQHPANIARHEERTFGQRAADGVTAAFGSWRFLIAQTAILTLWVVLNSVAWFTHWDDYPFILMNLAMSLQAAYAAPLILLSSNRAAEHDRLRAEVDYSNNAEALRLLRLLAPAETAVAEALAETAEDGG